MGLAQKFFLGLLVYSMDDGGITIEGYRSVRFLISFVPTVLVLSQSKQIRSPS